MQLETFDVHITGSSRSILKEFHKLNIKTLDIQLLTPAKVIIGNEYMGRLVKQFVSYEVCLQFVDNLVASIKSEIVRVKIECEYLKHYVDLSIYAEMHYPVSKQVGVQFLMPTVYNVKSNKYVSTIRTYDKSEYAKLRELSNDKQKSEFELCLYDSNRFFDNFWLSHYDSIPVQLENNNKSTYVEN